MKLKEYIYNRSVGAYLALVFSVLSILLTMILVEVIGVAATQLIKSNIGHGLAELALETSDKLDRGMFERYREIGLMANRADLIAPGGNPDDKRRIFDGLQETYPYYAWIGMTDAGGKVVVSAQKLLEGVDVSERPWFRNALKGINLGDVHEAALLAKLLPDPSDEPVRFVDLAFPYTDKHGRVAGVLGAHLSWRWGKEVAQSIIEPLGERRRVQAFIVNRDGMVLLGPPDMQGKTIAFPSLKAASDKHNGFNIETWSDNKQYLVGFSTSKGYASYPGLSWTVLMRQSVDDAFLPVKRIQQRVLWSGIAIAALFSLLGLFAARRITRPLWALAQSAQRIQEGETAEISPNNTGYFEVKALTGSLNSLVGNLLQKESALKELNLTLEKRVEQRTQELAHALGVVKENKERIKTIIERGQDAFIGVDLNGRIIDWNSRAEKMFGWRKEEAIGRPLTETIIPQRFRETYVNAIQRFRESGKGDFLNQHIERIVITRNGNEFPVEMTISLAGTSETYFFSAFLNDISERKEVERMKNEFISTVSHELRTPLTSIRGSLGLLTGGAVGEFSPQAKNLLDIANKNCERLVRMINNMLDIEKIESGNMRFEMVTQPLAPLVAQAIDATQGYAAQFNVKLELQSGASGIFVAVDRDRMIQVFVNLLSNAIKFSPVSASVKVRIGCESEQVRISVIDYGDGIPEEFRERIFEKFAQVDSTDSRQKGGTGLGLHICRSIVREHRGSINFHSEADSGTEFHVDLPVAVQTTSVPFHNKPGLAPQEP
jgi:PAS domain S-box-containing protein